MASSVLDVVGIGMAGMCALVDLDNDGDQDLYIVEREPKVQEWLGKVFRNDGGVFTDITERSGARMRRTGGASVDWLDYDNDGDLDGFVAGRYGRMRTRSNSLFEQVGPLLFRDVASAKGLDVPHPDARNVLLGSWFDYDGDGDQDLLLAPDYWGIELFRNNLGTFTRVTTQAFPPATDDTPGAPPNNPMGVTWGDYDNDGCFDVFVTGTNILGQGGFEARHLTDLASRLYRGNCLGRFTDVTVASGFWPTGLVEWSANFIDYDNDGDLDLSVVAGHTQELNEGLIEQIIARLVKYPRRIIPANLASWLYRYEAMIPAAGQSGPEAAMPRMLYRNQLVETGKASFVDVTYRAGVGGVAASRGGLWADMDDDGDLDWYVPSRRTGNRLFRNDGPVGNYLRVHVVGARHRQAIGAWVKIRAGGGQQLRHVHVLDGYLSQSQMDPHFGLGSAPVVDELWVRWPNTTTWVRMCGGIPANRKVVVTEGIGCHW